MQVFIVRSLQVLPTAPTTTFKETDIVGLAIRQHACNAAKPHYIATFGWGWFGALIIIFIDCLCQVKYVSKD